jgi:hypothetical protein
MSEWYFLIVAVFAIAYAIFGGIEFGLLTIAAFSGDTSLSKTAWRYFSPAWETSNVLLVGAITAIPTLYPKGLPLLAARLQTLWLVIGGLLIVRAILVLLSHYGESKSRVIITLLGLCGVALPFSMMQTVAVGLTGSLSLNALGVVLGGIGILFSVTLATAYLAIRQTSVNQLARTMVAATMTIGFGLLAIVEYRANLSTIAQLWPLLLAAIIAVVFLMTRRPWNYLAATVAMVLGLSWQLVMLQLPYLIRPLERLSDAATNSANASIIAIGFGIIAVIGLPTMVWLQRLIKET